MLLVIKWNFSEVNCIGREALHAVAVKYHLFFFFPLRFISLLLLFFFPLETLCFSSFFFHSFFFCILCHDVLSHTPLEWSKNLSFFLSKQVCPKENILSSNA